MCNSNKRDAGSAESRLEMVDLATACVQVGRGVVLERKDWDGYACILGGLGSDGDVRTLFCCLE